MTSEASRYCIIRALKSAPHLSPAPLREQQISAYAVTQMRSPSFAAVALCERSPLYQADVALFDTQEAAQELADSFHRNDWELRVAEIGEVAFDVWLHNHCDGSTHVQCRGEGFDTARLIFLATVGFSIQSGYWAAHFDVVCEEGIRKYWREPDTPPPINILDGQLSYDPWEASRIRRSKIKLAPEREAS